MYRCGSKRISEGLDLIILPYLLYVFGQTSLGKQCRPRSDAAERGVWSRSTLIATHPAILHTFTGSKMDLLKRRIRKSVQNLSNLSKISREIEIFSQIWIRLNPRPPLNPPLRYDTSFSESWSLHSATDNHLRSWESHWFYKAFHEFRH